MSVDYSRALNVQSFVQEQVDAAALSGVHGSPTEPASSYVNYVRAAVTGRYGAASWINNLRVQGEWLSPTDFRVAAKGTVPVTFLTAVPGFPQAVQISALAVARIASPGLVYQAPTVTQLDPQADDYNRISIYCFDPEKRNDPDTHGRTQMTVIADNTFTNFSYVMPRCEAGENISYKLLNVKAALLNNVAWDSPSLDRYEYYTDTTIRNDAETYDLGNFDALETVLCRTLSECKSTSEGGILPEGSYRTSQHARTRCSPGEYMYYGWEDTPPGAFSWGDRDYNDIRIVIGCPTEEEVGGNGVRLIR